MGGEFGLGLLIGLLRTHDRAAANRTATTRPVSFRRRPASPAAADPWWVPAPRSACGG